MDFLKQDKFNPLSDKDEFELLEKFCNGTEKEKIEAKTKIIEANLRWFFLLAKKYSLGKSHEHLEDNFQYTVEKAIKLFNSFDLEKFKQSKCKKYITYITLPLMHELYKKNFESYGIGLYRKIKSGKNAKYITGLMNPLVETPEGADYINLIKSDEDLEEDYEHKYLTEKIKETIATLKDIEKKVMNLYLGYETGESVSLTDIAQMLKCTRSYTSLIKRNSEKKIKKYLAAVYNLE